MAADQDPPQIFGIDNLAREVRQTREALLHSQHSLSVTLAHRLNAIETAVCGLDRRLERINQEMSEQIQKLDESVGGVEGAVANLVNTVTTEIEQVKAELERLQGQTNPDLSGPIGRLDAVKNEVNSSAQRLSELMPDEPPPPTGRRK